jgi:hypothetical protein
MKRISILQPNYMPWRGYYKIIKNSDCVVLYDDVQYTKNDWRNRNIIKSAKGPIWLTIPVRVKNLNQRINETYSVNNNWYEKHYKSIRQNYSKSRYYNKYIDNFQEFYQNKKPRKITAIIENFNNIIFEILEINTKIIYSSDLGVTGNRNERLIRILKKLGADTYLSGPSASSYIDQELFKVNKIDIEWVSYQMPMYKQVFDGFIPNLSIVDLIFNTGTEANYYF